MEWYSRKTLGPFEELFALFEEKKKKDSAYELERFFHYFTRRFCDNIEDESTIKIAKEINEKEPDFFTSYFKSILINEKGWDDYELSALNNLCTMISKLIESNIISVKQIAEFLEQNIDNLNFNYIPTFVDKISDLNILLPNLKQKIEEYEEKMKKLINDPEFSLPAAWPSVIKSDTSNPRMSKFGGCVPYLPEEPPQMCCGCHELSSMICQIYVPTTPDWFRNKFPPEKQDALIVVLFCNSCYDHVEGRIYYGKDIDRLVYSNDSYFDYGSFNEPRVVTKWNDFKMLPCSNNNAIDQIRAKYQVFNLEKKIEQFNPYLKTHIGGWPNFVQDDTTPNNTFLIANFESESESSTGIWGDMGTAQVWISQGEEFGDLLSDWSCS